MMQNNLDSSINNRVTDPMTNPQRSSYNSLVNSGAAQIFNNPLSPPSLENPLAKDWNRLNPAEQPEHDLNPHQNFPEHLRPTAAHSSEEAGFHAKQREDEQPKSYMDIDNQVLPALKANAG